METLMLLDFVLAMAPTPDGAEGGGGSPLALLPPMIIIFLIFYFILIKPQKKKQDEQRNMIEKLKEGDNVVTMSGFHGTIKKIKDEIVHLQIAENVKVKINRGSIAIVKDSGSGKEPEGKENKKDNKKDNKKESGNKKDNGNKKDSSDKKEAENKKD